MSRNQVKTDTGNSRVKKKKKVILVETKQKQLWQQNLHKIQDQGDTEETNHDRYGKHNPQMRNTQNKT